MQTIDVSSLSDFVERVAEIRRTQEAAEKYVSEPMFRGHSSKSFRLNSTLERQLRMAGAAKAITLNRYCNLAHEAFCEFASISPEIWRFPVSRKAIRSWDTFVASPEYIEWFIYLRHLGFPSPLLDWTHSPYVAAYFGCKSTPADPVGFSIFMFQEYFGHGKSGWSGEPHIHSLNPIVRTHQRHRLQQAAYTICLTNEGDYAFLADHETVFLKPLSDKHPQDVVVRFDVPEEARRPTLRQLRLMNINEYSLFQSEDALANHLGDMMIEREFDVGSLR